MYLYQNNLKAKLAGITVERVNDAYTSHEGPRCGHRKKPSGRNDTCSGCDVHGHRDVAGAASIRRRPVAKKKEVGSGDQTRFPGAMAFPLGGFRPHLQCSSRSGRKTKEPIGSRQAV